MVAEAFALVLAECGDRCHLCGSPGADTVDHIVPRSRGGTHELDNLRPAHLACNSARQDKTLDEWFAVHPLPVDRAAPSFDWTNSDA